MKFSQAAVLAAALWCAAPGHADDVPTDNVNARYVVESVDFSSDRWPVSARLLGEMRGLVGQRFDHGAFEKLASRIEAELRAREVTFHLGRGSQPEQIKVLFDVEQRERSFDVTVPRFVYDSHEGWSGEAQARAHWKQNQLAFSVLSDGDRFVERESGIRAGIARSFGDRTTFLLDTEALHEQYSRATVRAAEGSAAPALSRSRWGLQPAVRFALAGPLTLTVGASFERLQTPLLAATHETANAVIATLRYLRNWKATGTEHILDAGYSLRTATRILGSNDRYTRHALYAKYERRFGQQAVDFGLAGGILTGNAPLYERFVLGNASVVPGWSKFEIDPLGGTSMVHGAAGYRYHLLRVFYDAGSIASQNRSSGVKQSLGAGLGKDGFLAAVAFPLRSGHTDPVFYAGMNF